MRKELHWPVPAGVDVIGCCVLTWLGTWIYSWLVHYPSELVDKAFAGKKKELGILYNIQ